MENNTTYNTHTLANGLRVIHLPSPSSVIYCGYGVCAGTRDENDNEEGMAHFAEHATFKGTSRRRAMQILNCLETVGGDLNAFTNKEETVYHAAILKSHLPRAVDLLTDMVFHGTYPQEEIGREIEVICDEIESYNDSPSELIFDEFENLVFNGHPLGHNILGNAETLRTYSSNNIATFTTRYYRPENAIFFAYGDIDFNKLIRLLEKATADFPTCSPLLGTKLHVTIPEYSAQEVIRKKGTHQAHVMIGTRSYDVHDKRRMPLYLLNNILGGPGMNARLNISLREKNALVYSVDSTSISYSDTGMWCTYFGCDAHDVKKCRRLVRNELDKMIRKPLSPTQLAAVKRQIKGQIAVACDNRESFALDFAKSFLHYGWKKDVTALFKNIDEVTAEDIQNVARELFDKDALTTLIFN